MRSFPFTPEVFFSLFETYNRAIWPAQLVAYALGIAVLLLALRPVTVGGRIALAILSVFWLWDGIAYHLMHFLEINFAALGFGALFVLQGLLFAGSAIGRRERALRFHPDLFGWAGLFACLFALAVYPLLGWLAGHGWPRAAVFGVAPCPTVIFTFGVLLMLEGAPLYLAAIPLLWSLAGGSAVFLIGIPEDAALLVAGVVGSGLLVWKRRHQSPPLTASRGTRRQ